MIVKVPEKPCHYISLSIDNLKKKVNFMDSAGKTIDMYPSLKKKVHLQLPDYTISQVPVPLHCGINSLSHAYLNARAVVYGWTMCQLGVEKWDIYDLQYQKMLSEENARQFPKYLLSRTDSEDNSSDILQQNKTLVRTLLKEKVNQDKSLHEVKSIFLAKNISCDKVEELYVERKFVKYTFQRLLNQTQVYLTENADNISPVYIKSLFQGTSSLGEISPPLSSFAIFRGPEGTFGCYAKWAKAVLSKKISPSCEEMLKISTNHE